MTAAQLSALDLLLTVAGTALFFLAATVLLSGRAASRAAGIGALAAACAAALATGGRVVVVAVLAGHGWWFIADKVLLAVPLAIVGAGVAAVVAGPALIGSATGAGAGAATRRAAAGLFIAGYGSAAGLSVTFVVGYPVELVPAAVVVLVSFGLSGLTWVGLTGRPRRDLVAAFVSIGLVPLLASAGIAFYRHLQPVVIGAADTGHHLAAAVGAGVGPSSGAAHSVADLRTGAEPGRPVSRFTLTAREQSVMLPSGRVIDGWTFGSLPGPEIRVHQGDLVEVTLTNADIADGVTLHWHGYRVPNGEDGVAGITQDAVAQGESFIYRFVAADPGTYWYHAHQVSSEAVRRGLFGALIVEPVPAAGVDPAADLVVPVHTFDGIPVVGDTDGVLARTVPAGSLVRLRLINTDPTPHRISVDGASVTVAAVDGTEVTGPTPIGASLLRIPAGSRFDIIFPMPAGPVSLGVQGAPATGLRLNPAAVSATDAVPFVDGPDLDLLTYGTPAPVPPLVGSDVTEESTLVLDRQFRFLNGIPTLAQTVNGEVHPFVPPIQVREGDLLRLTVVNRSGETHPMHPHGHRVLVESRNGEPVRGSPLWLDTFDVQPGEVWTVLLRADNPGIWMAHCHNLEHATQGMVVHLTYQGVATPYALGGGPAENRPE
ncbi:MAG TPA: multicopper oxidase family protein [Nakamurella sp.]